MHVHIEDSSPVGRNLQPPSFPPHCCLEQVAATMRALAVEFDREATRGNSAAQGLSVAAIVLRDRADEALNGYLGISKAT